MWPEGSGTARIDTTQRIVDAWLSMIIIDDENHEMDDDVYTLSVTYIRNCSTWWGICFARKLGKPDTLLARAIESKLIGAR